MDKAGRSLPDKHPIAVTVQGSRAPVPVWPSLVSWRLDFLQASVGNPQLSKVEGAVGELGIGAPSCHKSCHAFVTFPAPGRLTLLRHMPCDLRKGTFCRMLKTQQAAF